MGDTTTLTLDQLIETIRTLPKGECAIAIVIKKPNQDVRVIQWRVDTEENLHKLLDDVRGLYPEHSNSEVTVQPNVVSVISDGRPVPITGHITVTLR
jgi:hypothetical protein